MADHFESIFGFGQFIDTLKDALLPLLPMVDKFVGMGKTFLDLAAIGLVTNELYANFIGGELRQIISRLMRGVVTLSLPLAVLINWSDMSDVLLKFGSELGAIVGPFVLR
jgi:hypothetical protein